jgi:LPXTG-motif cell wall-anchored protein
VMLDAGVDVSWLLTLTNTGDFPLFNVEPVWSLAGCDVAPRDLAVGASVTIACTTIMGATNTATAGGSEAVYGLSATDPATVTLRPVPESRVYIKLDVQDRNGVWTSGGDPGGRGLLPDPIPVYLKTDTITWRVTLGNFDDRPANNLTIQGVGLPGCDTTIASLAGGATTSFTCTSSETARTQRIAELFANGQVYTSNQATVDIALNLTEHLAVDAQVRSSTATGDGHTFVTGTPLEWLIVIANTGSDALTGVSAHDAVPTSIDLTGCIRSDGAAAGSPLQPAGTITCSIPFTAMEGGADRTITATATRSTNDTVTANDGTSYSAFTPALTARLTVLDPSTGLYVEADASDGLTPKLLSGGLVQWRAIIANTGTMDLTDVQPTWSSNSSCDRAVRSLAAGTTITINCSTTVTGDQIETLNATSAAFNLATSNSASIAIFHPSLAVSLKVADAPTSARYIEADASDSLRGNYTAGDTIAWRVTVTNSGDMALTSITVTTPGLTGCAQVIARLAAGASTTIDCATTATTSLTSNATAATANVTTQSNTALVNVLALPSATIDLLVLDPATGKYVDADDRDHLVPNVLAGKTVYWRVIVKNTGTVDLTAVAIGDTETACGPIDANGLAVGATLTQECTTTALYNRRAENRAENSGIIERTITMRATGMAAASDIARVFIAQPASIGDQVWYDTDGSDTMNGDERGQPGVVVHLYFNGIEIAHTTTDADGRYHFNNLLPGEYTVTFVIPSGNFITTGPARATSLGLSLAGGLATVHVTVSSGDIRPDISIGVRAQAVDLPVNTPTTTTPATAPTPPPPPTVPPRAGLPKTGTDPRNLLEIAGLVSLIGIGFVVLARRRKTTPLH